MDFLIHYTHDFKVTTWVIYMVIFVLDNLEQLDEVLAAWRSVGIFVGGFALPELKAVMRGDWRQELERRGRP